MILLATRSGRAGTLPRFIGGAAQADQDAAMAAKHALMTLFASTPYRPTGLATADHGMANVVQELEWCTSLVADALDGHLDLGQVAPTDRELLAVAEALF
jgi:hypothetical protein